MGTLFSKIISGEIPSYSIYEDELVFAFLDINPIQLGHTLIVPKVEIDEFIDVEDKYYIAVFLTAKKIAKAQKKSLNCTRVCTLIEGYEIPHFHYHLIPTKSPQDLHAKRQRYEPSVMNEICDLIKTKLCD